MILYGPDFNIRFDLRCWKNNYNSHSFFNQNKISFRFICIFNKIYPKKKTCSPKPNRFVDVITTFTFISVTWKTIFRSATRGFNWNVFQFWSCEMIHSQLPFPYLFYLTWEANLKKDHLCLSSPLLSSPPSLWTENSRREMFCTWTFFLRSRTSQQSTLISNFCLRIFIIFQSEQCRSPFWPSSSFNFQKIK